MTLSLVAAGLALATLLALALSLVGLLALTSSILLVAFNAGRSFLLFQVAFRYFLHARAVPIRHLALVPAMLLTVLIAAIALLAGLVSLLALAISLVLLITLFLLVLHCVHVPSDMPVRQGACPLTTL